MSDLIAAFDGGGTKTAGAMADRHGNIHILQSLGGCNPQDNPAWAGVLTAAIGQALSRARSPAHVVLGLPGYGEVPRHDQAMAALVADILPGGATVLNDVALAYHGAFAGTPGVMILAGTGSMAMAQGPAGLVRTGGWGDLFGDEGSAFWIGRRALALASRALDGRSSDSAFAIALMDIMALDPAADPFAPLNWLMQEAHPRSSIASVARHVDDLAERGDPVAAAILDRAVAHLVWQGTAAAAKAGLSVGYDWSSAGSVFRSSRVAQGVMAGLGRPETPPRLDALGGGLWLAARAAGWEPDARWIARVGAVTRTWAGQETGQD
jgi:glucosamine kinase